MPRPLYPIPGQPELSLRSRGGQSALTAGSARPCPTSRPRSPARRSPSRTVCRTATERAAARSPGPGRAPPAPAEPARPPTPRRGGSWAGRQPRGDGGGLTPPAEVGHGLEWDLGLLAGHRPLHTRTLSLSDTDV